MSGLLSLCQKALPLIPVKRGFIIPDASTAYRWVLQPSAFTQRLSCRAIVCPRLTLDSKERNPVNAISPTMPDSWLRSILDSVKRYERIVRAS